MIATGVKINGVGPIVAVTKLGAIQAIDSLLGTGNDGNNVRLLAVTRP